MSIKAILAFAPLFLLSSCSFTFNTQPTDQLESAASYKKVMNSAVTPVAVIITNSGCDANLTKQCLQDLKNLDAQAIKSKQSLLDSPPPSCLLPQRKEVMDGLQIIVDGTANILAGVDSKRDVREGLGIFEMKRGVIQVSQGMKDADQANCKSKPGTPSTFVVTPTQASSDELSLAGMPGASSLNSVFTTYSFQIEPSLTPSSCMSAFPDYAASYYVEYDYRLNQGGGAGYLYAFGRATKNVKEADQQLAAIRLGNDDICITHSFDQTLLACGCYSPDIQFEASVLTHDETEIAGVSNAKMQGIKMHYMVKGANVAHTKSVVIYGEYYRIQNGSQISSLFFFSNDQKYPAAIQNEVISSVVQQMLNYQNGAPV